MKTCWLEAKALIGGDPAAAPASFAKHWGCLESEGREPCSGYFQPQRSPEFRAASTATFPEPLASPSLAPSCPHPSQ